MTTVRRQRFQIIFFIITSGLRKRSYRRLETRLETPPSLLSTILYFFRTVALMSLLDVA